MWIGPPINFSHKIVNSTLDSSAQGQGCETLFYKLLLRDRFEVNEQFTLII